MAKKIAVFFDGENIRHQYVEKVMKKLNKKGKVVIKEVMMDWTRVTSSKVVKSESNKQATYKQNLINGWAKVVQQYSMTPQQQFQHSAFKNSSDIALAVNIVKTLYEHQQIDIFCIVSSDSDFIYLVQELISKGKKVIGFGERKSIKAYVESFTKFHYLDSKEDTKKNDLDEETNNKANVESEQKIQNININVEKVVINPVMNNSPKTVNMNYKEYDAETFKQRMIDIENLGYTMSYMNRLINTNPHAQVNSIVYKFKQDKSTVTITYNYLANVLSIQGIKTEMTDVAIELFSPKNNKTEVNKEKVADEEIENSLLFKKDDVVKATYVNGYVNVNAAFAKYEDGHIFVYPKGMTSESHNSENRMIKCKKVEAA